MNIILNFIQTKVRFPKKKLIFFYQYPTADIKSFSSESYFIRFIHNSL